MQLRESLHYSASQLGVFLSCPERFRLQYVLGMRPAHRSIDLVFGSSVHAVLARFHEAQQERRKIDPEEVSLDFTRDFAAAASAADVLCGDDESVETLTERGQALVSKYAVEHAPSEVLAVEHRFALSAEQLPEGFPPDVEFTGVLDVVERAADGTVWVTELKTAARKFDEVRLRYDLQMTLYAAACNSLGWPTAKLRFRVLLKGARPNIMTHEVFRDTASLAEGGRVATQVLRAVERGIFYPVRGWQCATCPYRSSCGT